MEDTEAGWKPSKNPKYWEWWNDKGKFIHLSNLDLSETPIQD